MLKPGGGLYPRLRISAGVLLASSLVSQAGPRGAVPMLAGMAGGMVWGMVASVGLYRLYFLAVEAVTPRAAA